MKKAFTLAEVLITITILGAIAAITLPVILSDINKNTWANSYKTNINVLNAGFKQMMAQEDVEDLRDTTLWSDFVTEDVTTKNDDITRELRKYFKVDKVDENWPDTIYTLSNTEYENNSVRFYLPNTATLNIKFMNDRTFRRCTEDQLFCHPVAEILLDVNGDKRPNIIGKDIYSLVLGEDGVLYPNGSEATNKYDPETYPLWDTEAGCQGKDPKGDGLSCAARVVDEGFKINYTN